MDISVKTTLFDQIDLGAADDADPATGRLALSPLAVQEMIRRALEEDIGAGDITSALLPAEMQLVGRLLVKADGVVAGLWVARELFWQVDPTLQVTLHVSDGAAVRRGDILGEVRGAARTILTAERTALNFLQRMSGIATATRRFVEAIGDAPARILDTRKTAPGLRLLDKWAVRLGGGVNHRIGLYDMVLIKDNHIEALGSLTAAVERARAVIADRPIPIEVEVTTLAQLEEALPLAVDRILLDNMSLEELRAAVARTAGRVKLEASGNVRLETVAAIAATGVDYISSGALTHSVRALDISLECTQPETERQ